VEGWAGQGGDGDGAGLSSETLRRALAFVQVVQEAPGLDDYRARILGLQDLIPCNAIGYNEVDLATGETFMVLAPDDVLFDGIEEAFARHAHQHPVIRHHGETGDPRPRSLSDFLS